MARSGEPRPGPELLSGSTLRDSLRALPPDRRRELLRSVRRGEPVARRRDAELAVSVARRQQRTAQYSWLAIPATTFVLWAVADLPVSVAVIGTVVAGYVATLVLARSVRSERVNRGLVDASEPPGATGDAGDAATEEHRRRRTGHLPGDRPGGSPRR